MRVALMSMAFAFTAALSALPAAEWRVWTVQDTRRVLREEPSGRGTEVKLAAARNEWESFQILLRSPTAVGQVNVETGAFKLPTAARSTAPGWCSIASTSSS